MKSYVITDAQHVGEVYRNTETLSYEEFVQMMMRILGNSEASVQAMFTPLPKDKEGFPNPHGKPLGILFRQMHIHQLFPGDNLTFLESRFYKFFDEHLHLSRLGETCPYAMETTDKCIILPLTQWCSDFFVKGGQTAYFGPRLAEINPDLTDEFLVFDELSYQVIYQYPTFLSKKMRTSRDRLLLGLKQYLQLPQDQRNEDAWFVKAMEEEMRAINMSAEDMAIATMTIYWAINTNSRKAAYWMLNFLLATPSLLDVVRKETAPVFRANGSVDFQHLHHSVPNLDAIWNEMLRLSAFAASVRYIKADTVVGTKILRKGNRVIIPYRQLHLDQSVFGDDVHKFRYQRFLHKPKLAQTNNFRPFGGGTTMCPGRHIAKRAVFLFTAILLRRFDVELEGDQKMLEPDLTRPVPGLMSPKLGDELVITLRPRKTS
ncbi:cytochrome P450 [Ustulina deusta]|nr:cytochrome P450 [Ustulina deusta]